MASLFSKAFDFLYIKAGKASNFKLKTEQKSIIEAVKADLLTKTGARIIFCRHYDFVVTDYVVRK